MAIRLDKAFGGGAATWLALQMAHDLAQARLRNRGLTIRRYVLRRGIAQARAP